MRPVISITVRSRGAGKGCPSFPCASGTLGELLGSSPGGSSILAGLPIGDSSTAHTRWVVRAGRSSPDSAQAQDSKQAQLSARAKLSFVRRALRNRSLFQPARARATCVLLQPAPGLRLSHRGPVSVRLASSRRWLSWLLMRPVGRAFLPSPSS